MNNQRENKRIPQCSVAGCSKVHYGKGFCQRHWKQFKKHGVINGDPLHSRLDDNEIIITGDVCRIVMRDNLGRFCCEALVDAEDADKLKKHKWHKTPTGYVSAQIASTRNHIYLHRYILDEPNTFIDHINGNGLDNRKENLRLCSKEENNRHSRKRSVSCSSIYKGVSYDQNRERWTSQIYCGRRTYLGQFNSEVAAALAYNTAAVKLFGQYAWLNDTKQTRKESHQ